MTKSKLALLAVIVVGCNKDDSNKPQANAAAPDTAAACAVNNSGLQLPAGFCATIFADSLGDARHVVVNDNGDVYVAIQATPPSPEEKMGGEETLPAPAAAI